VRGRLEPFDVVVSLGSDFLRMSVHSDVEPLPSHVSIIQIGLRDWEMGKNYPAEIAVRADIKETLRVLTPLITELGGAAQSTRAARRIAEFAGRNWTTTRKERVEVALAKAGAQPIDCEWLMLAITDLLPKGAIVVDEALTTAASLAAFLPMRDRYAYFGNVSGGIGWGIAAAVGVQLAKPDRRVVALLGDGSAMYSIQALWTAAHHKLPMTFVVFNNGGYRIIKQRLKLFHNTDRFIGMDFTDPPIEFAALAEALGVQGHRVETPAAFKAAFAEAVAASKPTLIEVMVDGSV
jgi:benzoylformate decarboxylase